MKLRKPIVFTFVGGFCFLVSLVVMIIQVEWLGINYLAATGVTWVLANGLGFLLNKHMTFKTPGHKWKREIIRYFGVMAGSFVVTMAFMYLAVTILGVNYLLSSVVLAFVMLGLNYLLHNALSFR